MNFIEYLLSASIISICLTSQSKIIIQSIEWQDKGVIVTYGEEFSDEDSVNAETEITSHPKFSSIEFVILDFLKVKNFSINTHVVADSGKNSDNHSIKNSSLKMAYISNSDVIKGLVNVYSAYQARSELEHQWDMRIFSNSTDALEWVNDSQVIA